MPEQKPCVRCDRPIDSYARSCVYCSWDQSLPRPAETAAVPIANAYVPPADNRVRNRILGAAAFAVLVVIAFFGSSFLHRSEMSDASAQQKTVSTGTTAPGDSKPRSTVVLVPVEGGGSPLDQLPVTSAPAPSSTAGSVETNGERTDATALPSGAYSVAAERARAERGVQPPTSGIVDPRTVGGNVEPAAPASRTPSLATPPVSTPRPIHIARTQPVPIYQPVPSMQVQRETKARLILTVGAEGRVSDINIAQSIPGEMPRLIAAVQSWRFRPAMENGHPVTSTFAVDITVRPR